MRPRRRTRLRSLELLMRSPVSRVDFCPRSNQRQRRRIGRKRLLKRGPGPLRDSADEFGDADGGSASASRVKSSSPRSAKKRPFDVPSLCALVRLCRQGLVSLRWRGLPHRSCATHESASCFSSARQSMIVHLIDGTYELFRHFYGLRRFTKDEDRPFGAVIGVLNTVLQMIETGATHVGVATDHVIQSFRNRLWSGYKTGDGIEPALLAQFHPLEEALNAMGVALWPMTELE